MRPHIVTHSRQQANVSHRRPINVVEGSLLQRLQLLEFILARSTLSDEDHSDRTVVEAIIVFQENAVLAPLHASPSVGNS